MLTDDQKTLFDLDEIPFGKDINPTQMWHAPRRKDHIVRITDALKSRQSVLLFGDPGAGKTCLLRAVRDAMPPAGYRLTYCHNATLGRRDFYRQLTVALGLNAKATAAALFHAVSTHVAELGRERIHPVFVLDEAHLLHQDTLDHLHILMNYEWDQKPLLSLVLVGLPELEDRLLMRRNRSLHSRLSTRIRLEPLSHADTPSYIKARLGQAGCGRDVFSRDALGLIHEASRGILREIDRIALQAMYLAACESRSMVEADHVVHVVRPQKPEAA